MAVKRLRLKSQSKSMTSAPQPRQQPALFGPPQLLPGEDAAAYDELLARISATVKSRDIIEEMFVHDLVRLQWEILRFQRLKTNLIKATSHKRLEEFLSDVLDYELYRDDFEERLSEILQEHLGENQANIARTLARKCADNESEAVEKVNQLLEAAEFELDALLDDAKAEKVEELAQGYARQETAAVKQVNEILAASCRTMDDILTEAMIDPTERYGHQFDCLLAIERIDRFIAIAETRRNASLHEIERHRLGLGQSLRKKVQEVEDGEFEVIEGPAAKGSGAA